MQICVAAMAKLCSRGLSPLLPLIEKATFDNIRSETDEQLSVVIKAYAATDLGFEGEPGSLDPVAVWTTTLDTAGE